MSATLELRIVAGLHAGAVVVLPPDGTSLTLGADDDNDVLLRDAGFATAHLVHDDGGWVFECNAQRIVLAPGDALSLPPLAIALIAPDQPWRDEALRWVAAPTREEPVMEAELPTVGMDPAIVTAHDEEDAGIATDERPAPATRAPQRARGTYALAGVATLAVLIATGIAVLLPAEEPPAPPAPVVAAAVDPRSVEEVVRAAGYAEQVRVLARPDGRVLLRGVVADEEAQEALLKTVSTVTRRVVLNLMTQAEFAQRVRAVTPLLPDGVSAEPAARGIVALSGLVNAEDDIALARGTMSSEVPEANGVDTTALTVRKPEPVVTTPRPPATPKLPRLVAVQGGANSYVLLASGERLLPGASINGYRLTTIEDTAIVVEDRGGRRYRIPR